MDYLHAELQHLVRYTLKIPSILTDYQKVLHLGQVSHGYSLLLASKTILFLSVMNSLNIITNLLIDQIA